MPAQLHCLSLNVVISKDACMDKSPVGPFNEWFSVLAPDVGPFNEWFSVLAPD